MKSDFTLLPSQTVQAARQSDTVIQALTSRRDAISFDWLRENFKRDNAIKDELKYGTAVLSSVAHLNQYLWTYGMMVKSQWLKLLALGRPAKLETGDQAIRLVDYGCGQGLAGIMLSDKLDAKFTRSVHDILLIEPSTPALVRAEAIYRNLFPHAAITCVPKMFDDLEEERFADSLNTRLHIFSNVLDIPTFNQFELFGKLLKIGRHFILAVSHDRDFKGGTKRITSLETELHNPKYAKWLTIHTSEIVKFGCGDDGKFPAVAWMADMSVNK
ncbi:hypothetical protein [Melittangium boletus]|uniref:hypothetical protein n=1 Tax=Melittangium boletus TaxID=83453 RepID=UPI003DA4809D